MTAEKCEVSSLGLELPGLGPGIYGKVSVSEATVSTTSLLIIFTEKKVLN